MKEVKTQNLKTFEIGTQEGLNVSVWILMGFQQSERPDSKLLNNGWFVLWTSSINGSMHYWNRTKHPDSGIILNGDDDDYS